MNTDANPVDHSHSRVGRVGSPRLLTSEHWPAPRLKILGPGAIPAVDGLVVEAVRTIWTVEGSSRPGLGADDAVARATGILGLGAVAVIHFAQVVSTIEQTPWLGAAFVGLTVACMMLAGLLLQKGSRLRWAQVAVLNFLAIGGYIFTRLLSTPLDNTDVGNWSEMLGLAALFIEGALVLLSIQVIISTLTASSRVEHVRAGAVGATGIPAEGAADAVATY